MRRTGLGIGFAVIFGGATAAQAAVLQVAYLPPFAYAYSLAAPVCAAAGGDTLAAQPAAGAPAPTPDVVIQPSAQIDAMIAAGQVAAGSKMDVAGSQLGMAVKAGAPKPDISTAEGLKRVVTAARSFGYSPFISGVFLSTEGLPALGVWEQVKDRGRVIRGEPVAAAVARGEVEIGFQQVTELLPVAGADFVARLPAPAQQTTVYAAGVGAKSASPEDARAFVACLASRTAAPALTRAGVDPLGPR